MDMECIFCRIVEREAPAYIVYEDEDVMAFLDIYPVSKGHTLVIPKKHFRAVEDTPDELLSKVWLTASRIARKFRLEHGAPGVNIVTNSGETAGQVVFHFHVHVIPRWRHMHGFWSGRSRLTEEEAKEVLDMLRDIG